MFRKVLSIIILYNEVEKYSLLIKGNNQSLRGDFMKMKIIIVLALILGFVSVGCSATGDVGNEHVVEGSELEGNGLAEIEEYFPFKENTVFKYEGIGNEYAEQNVFYEFIDGNKAQAKITNPGINMIKIYELKNGALLETYMEGEFYHIENMLNAKGNKEDIILKAPLEVGNSWESQDGYRREITSLDVTIETPSGTYEALEVTTSFDEGRFQKEYYAKGVGPVARIYTDHDHEIKTLLEGIKTSSISQTMELYYPLADGSGLTYIYDEMDFNTNDSVEKLIENKMKYQLDERLAPLFSEDVTLNRVNLDRGEWVVKADISDNFIEELNAGSTYEYEVIRSIVNTLGKFYDTDKVFITLSDRPYESGHLQLLEGETFKVDTEGIEELQ